MYVRTCMYMVRAHLIGLQTCLLQNVSVTLCYTENIKFRLKETCLLFKISETMCLNYIYCKMDIMNRVNTK